MSLMFSQRRLLLLEVGLLLIVTTLTYLPHMRQATIYRDDWYYTMDRMLGGPHAFSEMFRIDRPARGVFFEAYYQVFGVEPAGYHAAAFVWQLVLGLAAFALFRLLWPHPRWVALMMALLFVLYPGYTRWMEGFENQPKVVSLCLQVTSIALTLLAMRSTRRLPKIFLWVGSILTGWGYLALIDYAMGMEVFRFLCVWMIMNRENPALTWLRKGLRALRVSYPALLVIGGFLFWRVFLFHNARPETDIKLQLSAVAQSPLVNGGWWVIHLIQSFVNDAILAWVAPFFQDLFTMPFEAVLTGFLLAGVAAGLTFLAVWLLRDTPEAKASAWAIPWHSEALGLGALGVMVGVLPVVMANRAVAFGPFSHYGQPASLAAAIFIVGLVGALATRPLRLAAITSLVLLAVLNQYIASAKVLKEESAIAIFWQQMAWRAPAIRDATALMVTYPDVNYGEDVDAVNGPANFIYFPTPTNVLPVRYPLYAMKQYFWTAKEFLAGGKHTEQYRTHYGVIDNGYVLAISQPTSQSCVHVIDRRWPWFSFNDSDATILVGPNSNVGNILPKGEPPKLPVSIFGTEPAHGWCYLFEKADLAFQQKDWNTVTALARSAAEQHLQPVEVLEWMPFLQTYAILGDVASTDGLVQKMAGTAYNQTQICQVLAATQAEGYTFTPAMRTRIQNQYCSSAAAP